MAGPTVTLQSITGVDVELRIAGPGSRSYAFVIDWHIRLILAVAWFFAMLFLFGALSSLRDGGLPDLGLPFLFTAKVFPFLIYFLYHPILEVAMSGCTPGKRMAGVRLVSRSGDVPGVGALLVRNVFRLIDSLPALYLVGLSSVLFTRQNVRIGDLAAGTLLVHDETQSEKSSEKSFAGLRAAAANGGLNPQVADLAQELLDRWGALDDTSRTQLARSLLQRIDPTLTEHVLAQQYSAQLHSQLVERLASRQSP